MRRERQSDAQAGPGSAQAAFLAGLWRPVALMLLAVALSSVMLELHVRLAESRPEGYLHGFGPAAVFILAAVLLLAPLGRRTRQSLMSRLMTAFVAVSLSPFLLVSAMDQHATMEAITANTKLALLGAAKGLIESLDAFLESGLSGIRTESLMPSIIDYLRLPAEKRTGSPQEASALAVLNSLKRRDIVGITSYGILDDRGVDVLDTSAADEDTEKGDRDYFTVPMRTGLPYASGVLLSQQGKRPSFYFSSPVRDTTGRILGILRARYSANVLQRLIDQRTGLLGPGSFAILLDENLVRLADGHDDNAVLMPLVELDSVRAASLRLAHRPFAPLPAGAALKDLAKGVAGATDGGFFMAVAMPGSDEASLNTALRLSAQPWHVVFSMSRSGFLAGMERQAHNTKLLMVAAALLVGVAAFFMSRALAAPILRLTEAARRVGEGDLSVRAPGGDVMETRLLAESFNTMTQRLDETMQGLTRNVRELSQAQEALRLSEEKYRAIFENAMEGLFQTTIDGKVLSANPAVCRILGYDSPEEIREAVHSVDRVVYADPRDRERMVAAIREGGVVSGFEAQLLRRDGKPIWASLNVRAVYDKDGAIAYLEGSMEDVSSRKIMEEQLHFQAFHDPLTGLPNRLMLLDRLRTAVSRARRREGYNYAVAFLDLDRFKTVNDSMGHVAGDKLLVQVARRLGVHMRQLDTIARFGGDEFVLLLEEVESPQDALFWARRLKDALKEPYELEGKPVHISASLGLLMGPRTDLTPEQHLHYANVAMHQAKESGKDTVKFFVPRMLDMAKQVMDMEGDLRRACERGEFFLEYQPILDMRDGSLSAVEALVRWKHPERGVIPPSDFIPLAEETGLIVPLGRWVLEEACRQAAAWGANGSAHGVTVSVNISGRQLMERDLADLVRQALIAGNLRPQLLRLEVTETVVMGSPDVSIGLLDRLKRLGVQIAMDDFGTGYSSLAYLQRLPLDVIKIDRCFVSNMETDSGNREIVRAIISLAHSLGKSVVAEGIELDDQVRLLRGLKCEFGQGYLFSRPMPLEDVGRLIEAFAGNLAPQP